MINLVRVDDRLLHGQIICTWVPHVNADSLIVASDEAAGDELVKEILSSCAHNGLKVEVITVAEAAREVLDGLFNEARAILIVGDLQDAMRLYDAGIRFTALNIGNLHHEKDGRMITPSVIMDPEDEDIMEKFESAGVEIDIRAVPASTPGTFVPRNRTGA
jgi:PTS system mannose-specific IIB component